MKKVAIIRCLDVSMRCAGASCMKSFNSHTVKFERYGDEELELFASLTCNGCGQTVENDEGLKKKLDRLAEELGIPKEKAIMLEHMILTHHYEPEFGSPKKPLFPEAELLHYLDMMDAKMFDMETALAATKPGEFSDRVWTLDNRKLYKPTTDTE